jgi:uncharacterized protein with HEPN domain
VSRDWRLYVEEMIAAAERAIRFRAALARDDFLPGTMAFEAVVRQIEVFGEAAARIPEPVRVRAPAFPWRDVVDMRNRLIHGYFSVDADIVWDVVNEKLPQLLPTLRALLADQ